MFVLMYKKDETLFASYEKKSRGKTDMEFPEATKQPGRIDPATCLLCTDSTKILIAVVRETKTKNLNSPVQWKSHMKVNPGFFEET